MSASTGCPHARFAQLREQAPVSEIAPGVWAVTRHADVQRVLRDPQGFSARVSDGNDFALFGPSPVQAQIDEIMADYPERPVLMRTDPPEHKRVRNVVARVLTPTEVVKFEPRIRAIVTELMACWIRRGSVEFVNEFAMPLPGSVTTDFICGEPEMRERFRFWAGEIMSRVAGPQAPERQLEVARNVAQMGRYFLDRIAARRKAPTGDLISLVANARTDDGQALEDVAIVNVLETFMVGGNETTTFLLGNCLLRLAGEPELAARLRERTDLLPGFIEEMLRLEAPAQAVIRKTTGAAEFDGVVIPAGAMVMAYLVSANRDECAFAEPTQLNIQRPAGSRHLAFGDGNHSCLGLQLARAEVRIALEMLLPAMQDIRLLAEVEWLQNDFLRGPLRLQLGFRHGE
ncbi:cytochrome P450 [Pseudomonas sp. NBRC 100443]|uniref:cytochrome P450 n=1 Tax=Pseudomonas sp. NBRC 100443 TaxID=1113665 RepID=UPI00249FCA7A|nr:cytochrome P450 [Pseudomonas sp. NBRC 100443]GLU37309.1 cytochrome P450 [Pseudomonas sp. NBRC 100443]